MYVKYLILSTGTVVEKFFHSYDQTMALVNNLRHSKKCMLISYGKVW